MAAEIATPPDEDTGIPLSIAPDIAQIECSPDTNTWHHLFHPSTDPILSATLGGKALRSSRVQLLPAVQHNFGGHNYHTIFKGPELPTDPTKQFEICVFSAAGYMPENVIDISRQESVTVRPMSDAERAFFRSTPKPQPISGREIDHLHEKLMAEAAMQGAELRLSRRAVIRMLEARNRLQAALSVNGLRYSYLPMRDFFVEYMRRPEMLDVTPRFAKDFLKAKGEDRIAKGEILLERASVVASSGLLSQYRKAHRAGRLNGNMQPVPFELVRDKLGNATQRAQLLPLFADRLDEILSHQPVRQVA